MAAWTPITLGTNLQSLDLINELVLGYDERRKAIYTPLGKDPIEAGDIIQGYKFWKGMQEGLEDCADGSTDYIFIDDTISPIGLGDLPWLDQATWFTNAGIPDGWRRATVMPDDWTDYADPAYSYGYMQVGDIIGPWIYVDLQNAMSTLKHTGGTTSSDIADYPDNRSKVKSVDDADCATALAANKAAWLGAYAGGGTTYYGVYRSATVDEVSTGLTVGRYDSKVKTCRLEATSPSPCTYSWDLYFKPVAALSGFFDLDGLGLTVNQLYKDQSGAGAATWEITTPGRGGGGLTGYPGDCAPAWVCPISNDDKGAWVSTWNIRWVYKWNFTNA
jgi:hypothetical protein